MGISSISDWFWGNGKTRNEEPLYTIETGENTRESLGGRIDSGNGNKNTGQYTFGSSNKSVGTTANSTNKNAVQTGSTVGGIYDNDARQTERKAQAEEKNQEVAGPVVYDTRQTEFVTPSQMKTYNNGLSYIKGSNASSPGVGSSSGGGTVFDNSYSENSRNGGSNTGYGTFVSDSDLLDADGVYKELDVNANNILKNGGESAYYSEDYLKANAAKNNREKFLKAMNAEERKTYLGLDESRREGYLQSIEPALNQRLGQKEAELIMGGARDSSSTMGYSALAGFNSVIEGGKGMVNNLLGKETVVARNPLTYAYNEIRPKLEGAEAFFSDLSYSLGAAVPTIAAYSINPALGKVVAGAASGGNAYDNAIAQGYGVKDARKYSYANMAKDLLLEEVVGSVPFVSKADNAIITAAKGKVDDILEPLIKDKNIRKTIAGYFVDAVSEGSEEALQTFVDPVIGNAILGTDEKVSFKDVAYNFALGMATSGAISSMRSSVGKIGNLPDGDMNNVKADMNLALSLVDSGGRKAQEEYRSTLKDYGFEDTVKTMDSVAEKLGKRVEFGFGDAESADKDTIKIDLKEVKSSKDAVTKVIAGDIAEKVDSERTYKELVSTEKGKRLLNDFAEEKGYSSLEEMRTKIQEKAAEKGKILSDGEADADVVKKLLSGRDVLGDRAGMAQIAEASPELAQEIINVFAKERELFKGTEFEADVLNGINNVTLNDSIFIFDDFVTTRPTWKQSEEDARKDLPEYKEQRSFLNGKKASYGTKGSVRPDYFKDGSSVDIKNYDVMSAKGRNNLVKNVEKQYYERVGGLPDGTSQSVIIDIRGQKITDADLSDLYYNILKRTNGGISIRFKSNRR